MLKHKMPDSGLVILSSRRTTGTAILNSLAINSNRRAIYDPFNTTLSEAGFRKVSSDINNLGHPPGISYFSHFPKSRKLFRLLKKIDLNKIASLSEETTERERQNQVQYLNELRSTLEKSTIVPVVKLESPDTYEPFMSVFPKFESVLLLREQQEVFDSYEYQSQKLGNDYFYSVLDPSLNISQSSSSQRLKVLETEYHKHLSLGIRSADWVVRFSFSSGRYRNVRISPGERRPYPPKEALTLELFELLGRVD